MLWPNSGWIQDDSAGPDRAEAVAEDIAVLKAHVAASPLKAWYSQLAFSVFQGDCFLLPGMLLGLKLDRSPVPFCLNSAVAVNNVARVEIHKAVLHVRKCEVNDSVRQPHMELLTRGSTVKYPITRTNTSTYVANTGVSEYNVTIEQNGQFSTQS